MLFYQLVDRQVEHVVLDCEVGARRVDIEAPLVVDDQDPEWGKVAPELLADSFRAISLDSDTIGLHFSLALNVVIRVHRLVLLLDVVLNKVAKCFEFCFGFFEVNLIIRNLLLLGFVKFFSDLVNLFETV